MAENSKYLLRIIGIAGEDLGEVQRSCKEGGSTARKGKIANISCVLVIHVIYMFNNFLSCNMQIQILQCLCFSPVLCSAHVLNKKDGVEFSSSKRGGKWKRGSC